MSAQNPIDGHSLAEFLNWLQRDAPEGTVVMTVSQALAAGRG
jgi:hypothetical protein